MTQQKNALYTGTVTTGFSATGTVVQTDDLPDGSYILDAQLVGKITGGAAIGNVGGGRPTMMAKRNSGTLTLFGVTGIAISGDGTIGSCTGNWVVSGSKIQLQMTSPVASTIEWLSTIRVLQS